MNKSKLCNLKTVVLASLLIFFGSMLVYSVFKSRVLEGNTAMGDAFNSGAGGASSDRAISTAGEVSKILATSDYKRGPPQVDYGQPTIPSSEPTIPSSQPTIPSSQPTIPSSQPTIPSSQPTIPSSQPKTPQVITPVNSNNAATTDTGSNVITVSAVQTFPY